ncbi:MAG: putative bifunctional diguanylate cyclase/phosphodiesterase [Gammaproteobacteria bacterium]
MQIPKVLLVNDDPASLLALESLLSGVPGQPDYQIVTAASGKEALRHVLQHEFAVILLDVNMPGMDGFETAEAIHSHPRSSGVPIIFITAYYADEMHRLKGYQKGAVDYLLTPVIPQVLQTKVAVFVELTRKNLELLAKSEQLARLNEDLHVQRLQDLERANRELEQEVAERKLAEERAHALAVRDPLTNLVNRRTLIQQLEHAVAYADRYQGEFALLFLDLDRFKSVNDSFGIEAGDELLRQVAARLVAAVRVSDVVARLSSDEFAVLLEGAGAAANAARVARKIEQAHALAFEIGGQRIYAMPSIGIALYPQDGASASQVMKNAAVALEHAKRDRPRQGQAHSHGSIEFFRAELNAREQQRQQRAAALRQSLGAGEFELRFEPIAALPGRTLSAVEAVLFWRHPDEGLVPAHAALDDVNDPALLEQISAWAVEQACQQLVQWRGAAVPLPHLTLALDLHVARIEADLAERVLASVQAAKLAPGELQLDIPEALLAEAGPGVAEVLQRLHMGGVALALDDFDSAGVALATLLHLPLDLLKLDAAFVQAIGSEGGADMAAALIHLGRALGVRVAAQGVETDAQLAALSALPCERYQGALFHPILDAAALLPLLGAVGAQDLLDPSRTSNPAAPTFTPKLRGNSR